MKQLDTQSLNKQVIIATKGDQHIRPESGNIYEIKTKDGERYVGDSSANYVCSGSGDDELYGNKGNDHLSGGSGDDTLDGGEGDDFLSGDSGKDRFIYDNIGDGDDLIFDFQVGSGADADVLDLTALLSYNQGDDINDFISFIDSGINSTTINITLYIDADGNASGTDVSIYLVGVTGTDLNTMINDGNIVLL